MNDISTIEMKPPKVKIVWLYDDAINLIPSYENQAINLTVLDQLRAAGVTDVITSNDEDDVDIIFLVNNFPLFPQLEASQQPPLDPTQT